VRVAIIGNSGSGKSTLAQVLATTHCLERLDLDTVAWEPDKVAVARDPASAARDVADFCDAHERWVVEGCYAGLIGIALQRSPLLLFIEPGVAVCLDHCRRRPWEPHKYSSKHAQDRNLPLLLTWVEDYYVRDGDPSFLAHQALFDAYAGPKRKFTARVEPAMMYDAIGADPGGAI
jgi:adenylate kinase family enzyme